MKKLIFLVGIIFVLTLSIVKVSNATPATSQCLSFKVTFTAKNWIGGPIEVGCQGLNAGSCTGGKMQIRPGNTKTLNNCACPFNTKKDPPVNKGWADGCLYAAKELKIIERADSENRPGVDVKTGISQQCTINTNKFELVSSSKPGFYKTRENVCGQNKQEVDVPISITCPGPSITATPTPKPNKTPTPKPSKTPTPKPSKTPTPRPSASPTPRPSISPTPPVCPIPEAVTNVKVSCPNCFSSQEN